METNLTLYILLTSFLILTIGILMGAIILKRIIRYQQKKLEMQKEFFGSLQARLKGIEDSMAGILKELRNKNKKDIFRS